MDETIRSLVSGSSGRCWDPGEELGGSGTLPLRAVDTPQHPRSSGGQLEGCPPLLVFLTDACSGGWAAHAQLRVSSLGKHQRASARWERLEMDARGRLSKDNRNEQLRNCLLIFPWSFYGLQSTAPSLPRSSRRTFAKSVKDQRRIQSCSSVSTF